MLEQVAPVVGRGPVADHLRDLYPLLRWLANRRRGVIPGWSADDLVQEGIVHLLAREHRWDQEVGAFLPWATTVVGRRWLTLRDETLRRSVGEGHEGMIPGGLIEPSASVRRETVLRGEAARWAGRLEEIDEVLVQYPAGRMAVRALVAVHGDIDGAARWLGWGRGELTGVLGGVRTVLKREEEMAESTGDSSYRPVL